MSSEPARRLAQTVSDHLMARETLIASLPPRSTITIIVRTGDSGAPSKVQIKTESESAAGDVTRRPSPNGANHRS